MPTWGLTKKQRTIEGKNKGPWGLHPRLLEPAKVTTDPVHGDIYTTWLEQAIVDSPPFQRLRRIKQLGTTDLVYPGASHTRFAHSLGTLRVAQDLLDSVLTQHEGRHPVHDLVKQWKQDDPEEAERHAARAIVVTRLGALLHDLGHVPFGHSIEDDLKVLVEHDANELRFRNLWRQLARFVRQRVRELRCSDSAKLEVLDSLTTLLDTNGCLHQELLPVVISKRARKGRDELRYPFAADLVGNTICADLLDYLRRDHLATGLPFALGRRFMSAFFIVPEGRGAFEKRVALSLMRNGHEQTDVVTELLKALRYRYELSERALVHHAKLAADAMLGKALECWSGALWLKEASGRISEFDDTVTLQRDGDILAIRRAFGSTLKAEYRRDAEAADEKVRIHPVDRVVRRALEHELVGPGDDALLEKLASFASMAPTDERLQAAAGFGEVVAELYKHAGQLGQDFLNRRLFKATGRVGIEDAPAEELYESFSKNPRDRAALERDAQRFAGITGTPQVLIWLPKPHMRVKVAEVLVDDGKHIDRFAAYEAPRGHRGTDIYGSHARLWSLYVFTHPNLTNERCDEVLAYLAERLGVAWEQKREQWGDDYWRWVDRLIVARLLDEQPGVPAVTRVVEKVAAQPVGRGEARTFASRRRQLRTTVKRVQQALAAAV
jgi:HD superfamily phosphohydrolase